MPHIRAPDYRDTLAQHLDVDVGKSCAYLDLRKEQEKATMYELAADEDVFPTIYRTAVNRRFGLLPQGLAARSKRGLVCMAASAYGHNRPWQNARDLTNLTRMLQVASGLAVKEGGDGPPKSSLVFYFAYLMTGYFAAAGMMAALLRRSIEGGSYHVKLSLVRSAM